MTESLNSDCINNRIEILILQHPSEQDVSLGTARLVSQTLQNVRISTGLSWPNFEKALGQAANPKRWAVLYLGGVKVPDQAALVFINRKKEIIDPDQHLRAEIDGIVVLDGTWSQAKSLWWRNPWLLKLNRIAIKPFQPSLYGKLRKEPRRESVSTLEAVAAALVGLGEPVDISKALMSRFRRHLEDYRTTHQKNKT